jgi:hypothetical protein
MLLQTYNSMYIRCQAKNELKPEINSPTWHDICKCLRETETRYRVNRNRDADRLHAQLGNTVPQPVACPPEEVGVQKRLPWGLRERVWG